MTGRKKAHKILTIITFLSVLAAMGCGTNSPVSPTQETSNMPGVENPQFVQLLPASNGADRPMYTSAVTQVVSAEGGTVSNGYYSLYFPPGALDEDTEITLEMPYYPSARVRLGPHGIRFWKDVILSLDLDMMESSGDELTVLWYNEDSELWEDIGGYVEDGELKADLEHFSEYGDSRQLGK